MSKYSQEQARYRAMGRVYKCAQCVYFIKPAEGKTTGSCKKVAGDISPDGVSILWSLMDRPKPLIERFIGEPVGGDARYRGLGEYLTIRGEHRPAYTEYSMIGGRRGDPRKRQPSF